MRGTAERTDISSAMRAEVPPEARLDRLALLYEGLLTVIGRVHTGRQKLQNPEQFRERMKQALDEVTRTAARRGYSREVVQEGTFAVVAFLDETILTAPDASTADWVGKSLAEELFNERIAGELFFQRLDNLRSHRDSQDLAEILEVYYLCLLLGYEGKFAGGSKGELLQIKANLRERIGRIYEADGRETEFSPDRNMDEAPAPVVIVADPLNRQLRLFAVAAFAFALLCYIGFSLTLHNQTRQIHRLVLERIAPPEGKAQGAQP